MKGATKTADLTGNIIRELRMVQIIPHRIKPKTVTKTFTIVFSLNHTCCTLRDVS